MAPIGKTDAENRRCKALAALLGLAEAEVRDTSLPGLLKIIARLKAARRVEAARGRAGSWLYDVNRHLNLCAALRREYGALAAYFPAGAGKECPASVTRPTHSSGTAPS